MTVLNEDGSVSPRIYHACEYEGCKKVVLRNKLSEHVLVEHENFAPQCEKCGRPYSRKDSRKRHRDRYCKGNKPAKNGQKNGGRDVQSDGLTVEGMIASLLPDEIEDMIASSLPFNPTVEDMIASVS